MKKIVLVLVAMAMLNGCVVLNPTYHRQGWVRIGASQEEFERDFKECQKYRDVPQAPPFIKEGVGSDQLQKDFAECSDAETVRGEHRRVLSKMPVAWPFAYLVDVNNYCRRCMESRGYRFTYDDAPAPVKCMKEKGYEWRDL